MAEGGRYTHGYYGVGKPQENFGLSLGMALPPGTMPSENERGRKRAATFSVKAAGDTAGAAAASPSERKPSLREKLRSFFKRGKQKYIEDEGARGSELVAESGTVHSSTFERSELREKRVSFQEDAPAKPKRGKSLSFSGKNGHGKKREESVPKQSQSFDEGKVLLIKLTLRPKNAVTLLETRKVTLRRQADGFGVHLSPGLPPIKVTYVKSGGMAELAGVEVGDTVVEVNGQNCSEGVEIAKIMELKMLLQKTAVNLDAIEEGAEAGEKIDESAWKKIKARQESLESDASDAEITMIDEESESENEKAEPTPAVIPAQVPAKPKPKKRKAKKRKRDPSLTAQTEQPAAAGLEQQSLPVLQDLGTTATSTTATAQEKRKVRKSKPRAPLKDELEASSPPPPLAEAVTPTTEVAAVSPTSESKPKKRKKQKTETSGRDESWTQQQDFVLDDKPQVEKKKKRVKKSHTTDETMPLPATAVQPVITAAAAPTEALAEMNEGASPLPLGPTENRVAPGSEILQSPDGRVRIKKGGKKKKKSKTLLDDGKPITSTPDKKKKKHSGSKKASNSEGKLDKSKSGSVQSDTLKWVGAEGLTQDYSNSMPRQSGHDDRDILGLSPIKGDKRSPSVHTFGDEPKPFREELRQASKSEYDMPDSFGEGKLELDTNLRVRKSGLVIGTHTREERRPSIFDQSSSIEEVDQGDEGSSEGAKKKASTVEMDLTAIPKLNPSLGLSHGHNRLELVSRGSQRRRPASKKRTLLLDTEDDALMGTKRVDLSADGGDDRPVRRQTMPSTSVTEKSNIKEAGKSKDDSSLEANSTAPASPVKPPASPVKWLSQKEREKENSKGKAREERERKEDKETEAAEKPKNHVLDAHIQRMKNQQSPLFSPSTSDLSTSAAIVTRQLSQNGATNKSFELPTRQSVVLDSNSKRSPSSSPLQRAGRRSKTVDTPVKTLGIASESSPTKRSSPVKLRRGGDEAASTPSWVAIAQVKHKRVSAVYENQPSPSDREVNQPKTISEDNRKVVSSPPSVISALPPRKGDPLLPKTGTVKDRMALFQ